MQGDSGKLSSQRIQSSWKDLNTDACFQATCKGEQLCSYICSTAGCKQNAFLCANDRCQCHKKHNQHKSTSNFYRPSKIIDLVITKESSSSHHLVSWLENEVDALIQWVREFRRNICQRLSVLGISQQQQTFLSLLSSKSKNNRLTGDQVSNFVKGLGQYKYNFNDKLVETLQCDMKSQWKTLIDPVKIHIQSLETVFASFIKTNPSFAQFLGESENTLVKSKQPELGVTGRFFANIINSLINFPINAKNQGIQGNDIIDYINKQQFSNPTQVYLEGNKFKRATIEQANLSILDVSCNHLKSIRFSKNVSQTNPFKLKNLILNNNQISDITELAMTHLPYLERLNVQNNKLSVLPELIAMPQLKFAYFGCNQFEDVSELENSNIRNIVVLSFTDCIIKNIDWLIRLLPTIKKLMGIGLDDNRIEQLPDMSVLQHHPVKIKIALGMHEGRGNPISNYKQFLLTNSAAFKQMQFIGLSLVAKDDEQFKRKKQEFESKTKLKIGRFERYKR